MKTPHRDVRADEGSSQQAQGTGRRDFLGLAGAVTVLGATLPLARNMPGGFVSTAYAQDNPDPAAMLAQVGKNSGLSVIGDRPFVAEAPEHLLNDDTTPIDKFFVRQNGIPPEAPGDAQAWSIIVEGSVDNPLTLTLADLKQRFENVTFRMVLECGGNGRSFFNPPARGNQWTNGGAGCAEWTGVRLRDVLLAAGLKPSAAYTGHFGADSHLSGDADREVISRGVRIEKALEEHSMIVWGMNGQDLPLVHGGPLRLIIPGWPGSASQKWLTRILIRDDEHDGPGMTGTSYRVPATPMIPGSGPEGVEFRILESMPLRSIVSSPANGTRLPAGTRKLELRGAAWGGDVAVSAVHVSLDAGATWHAVDLQEPRNRYDWRRWTAAIDLPSDGYYEIWARATGEDGTMQPHVVGNWNPQGYGGNPMHRLAVLVG
ncbi:sulfite oxidase [Ochrobactrum sp. WV_118_8]|uniref:Molybdopterin-dependent oxidoreductase n=1 Tax=Stappia indica TaxID=538381 RepID=A0A857C8U6_9HYPH|nr:MULTISPECIES: sulfite oxidase [Hyphomicrobiales]QGZ35289.1 molybdopterin-dependent oxidoreductase [Stappia indica]